MKLHTTSEVISLAKRLESESANLYQELSQKYPDNGDLFLSFVKENRRNITQIERAYFGAISDALESCFAFDMDVDEHSFDTRLVEKASCLDDLALAIGLERKIIKFYSDAAEQSKSLMADVPRNFALMVPKRTSRIQTLKSLTEKKIDPQHLIT